MDEDLNRRKNDFQVNWLNNNEIVISKNGNIMAINIQNKSKTKILDGYNPLVIQNNHLLVYNKNKDSNDIYLYDLKKKNTAFIFNSTWQHRDIKDFGSFWNISFSNKGKYLFYSRWNELLGKTYIYVLDIETKKSFLIRTIKGGPINFIK